MKRVKYLSIFLLENYEFKNIEMGHKWASFWLNNKLISNLVNETKNRTRTHRHQS